MNYEDLITLGIAFGLGLLVGLQREKSNHEMAGVRTFTLIAILGAISGFITRDFENPYLIPALAIAITGLMVTSNFMKIHTQDDPGIGKTTEIAVLLMYAIGVYLVLGDRIIGVLTGGTLVILLYIKETLHNFIHNLKDKDLSAIMTFAAISLVILPILPDKTYGALDVLNPHEIWLMVILIVGISILGYFVYKWLGKKVGMLANGILGGIISSTATTVSYARYSANNHSISSVSAFVILTAVTVSMIRVIVEISVVAPNELPFLILPLLVLFVFMILLSVGLYYTIYKNNQEEHMPEPENPAQFKSALIFGLLYGIIILAVAFAEQEFGDSGLYYVSVIGGLANKDAITLSLAHSVRSGLDTELGWRLIMTGVLSNLAFKIVLAALVGNKQLTKWIGITMTLSIMVGLLLIFFWPESWHLG
ncbi:MgtC/SapB family protein [Membranicola marinus]|uniref:MgtC/SapB family protein n=1 Tax=Membranihabitans marinus TaxID=1227546 RepID=A0A953HUY4_9BACT|nr:MgtC/SapB family protein [Membranihabitans marinus]MBY5958671.1 MgtC/SapB family protein [Membranihabitans marinus]